MQAYKLGTLTIPNADTKSNAFTDARTFAGLDSLLIICPAALTGAVKLESAPAADSVDADFRTVQQPAGTDIALAAGKAVLIERPAFVNIRVKSGGAEAAARDFILIGSMCR